MQLVETKPINQVWANNNDIADIFNYKSPATILKKYRGFCDKNPIYFKPHKPYLKFHGKQWYTIFCFAFYFENRDLLEIGSRSMQVSFQKDLERIKKVYAR